MSIDGPVLVTGAAGCIGAWVVAGLVQRGKTPVVFDLSEDRRRLRLLLSDEQANAVKWLKGDLTDTAAVERAIGDSGAAAIIHLAALQVPFCKADPVLGARVNVVGHVNVFEAARKRGVKRLVYASSIAALPIEGGAYQANLYGVYKAADEGIARIYAQDWGVASVGLRPHTVYGPGRDQGLTSAPTKAMLAAAADKPYTVPFRGTLNFQYAGEVANLHPLRRGGVAAAQHVTTCRDEGDGRGGRRPTAKCAGRWISIEAQPPFLPNSTIAPRKLIGPDRRRPWTGVERSIRIFAPFWARPRERQSSADLRFRTPSPPSAAAATVGQALAQDNGEGGAVSLVSDQIILIATVVGAVATLPTLIEFLIDRRKRKERIALSLDDLAVADLDVRLAGLDALLADIVDLIDRAKHPEAYASLKIGNEILIIGPAASGKKTLAQRIAKDAGMDRLIIVYNARNADALTSAKSLLQRYRRHKVMLLLPRLDNVVEDEDEGVLAELDALIRTTTEARQRAGVGTAVDFEPGGLLDNMFGIVLALPGTPVKHAREHPIPDDARRMLVEVARFYLGEAKADGFALIGLDEAALVDRIARTARNPADVADIIVLAETTALHRQRTGVAKSPEITAEIVEKSIRRVIVTPA
jgi:NAD(P)-dependent dehydrogenase (short-subunit alcohol dehydrogenase family)